MSHFYASIQGSRGRANRCGTKSSGHWGHIRGWNIGACVDLRHEDGQDVVTVYATHGSAGHNSLHLATFKRDSDGAGYHFTGGLVADLIEAAAAVVADMQLFASRQGPGPDVRLETLRAALKRATG